MKNIKEFKNMLNEMHTSELVDILNHPNFSNRKQVIKNELNKRKNKSINR